MTFSIAVLSFLAVSAYAAQSIPDDHAPVTYIEINPNNYKHNLEQIKKMIGPDIKICLVMKANAYGHGIANLIPEAIAAKPAYIAAIYNSEFQIIRKELKERNADIALLRIAPVSCDEFKESVIKQLDVEEMVGSFDQANLLSAAAGRLSKELGRDITVNVHLCVETGMGRTGFRNVEEIKASLKLPCLKPKGMMTHFANAYAKDPGGSEKTKKEVALFDRFSKELRLDRSVILHAANSAATVRFPWARKDMVRVGTLTYGEDVEGLDPDHRLRPVLEAFKSKVTIIERNVPAGSAIGYDSRQHTRSDRLSTTATIRAGYSEGIPEEAFKKNMQVLIKGKRFPVIGKSSMNMIVVDITDQDQGDPVLIDDEVVLIGKQAKEEITLEEFSGKIGCTITQLTILLGNSVDKVVLH